MAKLFDLARMTTSTTGTGTITLGSAATGYLSFATAGVADQDIVAYGISDGVNSEVGFGTYSSTGTSLTRNVTASTNSNTAISLSGSAQVFIIARAEDLIRAPVHPGGRLTLTSATPVLTSGVSGATTVYYTPYKGSYVPLWDGKSWAPYTFAEMSQATTDTTKSPAACVASTCYDLFVWNDAGTLRCTRGPAWTTSTDGAGARNLTLTLQDGLYLNTSAITNGPAALRGTYVGTIKTNSLSKVDMVFGGTNTAATLMVWNFFNRVQFTPFVTDTAATNTYASLTTQQAGTHTYNQITFVTGLTEDSVNILYKGICQLIAAPTVQPSSVIGIGLNSTSTFSDNCYFFLGATGVKLANSMAVIAGTSLSIGTNTITALEASDGTNANNFNLNSNNRLTCQYLM